MSRYIATRAIKGANALVTEAEVMLSKAINDKGKETKVEFPNTAYFLPTIFGMTGIEVKTLQELIPVLEKARRLLHPLPAEKHWTPYLGETLDSGMAIFAGETTLDGLREIFNIRVGDKTILFHTPKFKKVTEELNIQEIYDTLQIDRKMRYRPWYPNITNEMQKALNLPKHLKTLFS